MMRNWFKAGANKFGNIRTKCEFGHNHTSMLESSVCYLLHLRLKDGEFTKIDTEVTLKLGAAQMKKKTGYRADFRCLRPDGTYLFAEAKGKEMATWSKIKAAWMSWGPGNLEIWKGTAVRPVLTEIIVPDGFSCPHCHKDIT